MSNYKCEKCGTDIIEGPGGFYITECEHYKMVQNSQPMNQEEEYGWKKNEKVSLPLNNQEEPKKEDLPVFLEIGMVLKNFKSIMYRT